MKAIFSDPAEKKNYRIIWMIEIIIFKRKKFPPKSASR